MLAEEDKEVLTTKIALPMGPIEALLSLITSVDIAIASSTLVGSSSGTLLAL